MQHWLWTSPAEPTVAHVWTLRVSNPSCFHGFWKRPNTVPTPGFRHKEREWMIRVVAIMTQIILTDACKNTKLNMHVCTKCVQTVIVPSCWPQILLFLSFFYSSWSTCPVGTHSTPYLCSLYSHFQAQGCGYCCCVTWKAGGCLLNQAFM